MDCLVRLAACGFLEKKPVKFFFSSLQVLKQTLLRKGFEFESETDTEVIPKLTKYVYDQLTKDKKGDEIIPFRQVRGTSFWGENKVDQYEGLALLERR